MAIRGCDNLERDSRRGNWRRDVMAVAVLKPGDARRSIMRRINNMRRYPLAASCGMAGRPLFVARRPIRPP